MAYSPEGQEPHIQFTPEQSQEKKEEALSFDFSGRLEWKIIIEKLKFNRELINHPDTASPEQLAAIIREGTALEAKEMLLDQRDIFDVEEEVHALFESKNFSIPFAVIQEMLPIHQYFSLLIEHGRATQKDERAYFEMRFGWASHPDFPFGEWDDKLVDLNILIRQKTCGRLDSERFNSLVNEL